MDVYVLGYGKLTAYDILAKRSPVIENLGLSVGKKVINKKPPCEKFSDREASTVRSGSGDAYLA